MVRKDLKVRNLRVLIDPVVSTCTYPVNGTNVPYLSYP